MWISEKIKNYKTNFRTTQGLFFCQIFKKYSKQRPFFVEFSNRFIQRHDRLGLSAHLTTGHNICNCTLT